MSERKRIKDFLAGGPGLSGYAYQADTYCVGCGYAIICTLYGAGKLGDLKDNGGLGTTEECPQPIFFGESPEREVHCASCDEYMYGHQAENGGES